MCTVQGVQWLTGGPESRQQVVNSVSVGHSPAPAAAVWTDCGAARWMALAAAARSSGRSARAGPSAAPVRGTGQRTERCGRAAETSLPCPVLSIWCHTLITGTLYTLYTVTLCIQCHTLHRVVHFLLYINCNGHVLLHLFNYFTLLQNIFQSITPFGEKEEKKLL